MRPKLQAFSRYRPRVLTLVVLFLIAAPITLANFTSEVVLAEAAIHGRETTGSHQGQYGWPLIWHWHNLAISPGPCGIFNWEYSPARLAGNVALWLLMLAVPAGGCEWLLRRYRPGLRWSLRTMLIVVAVAAVCSAWFAAARSRANLQDALIAELEKDYGTNSVMIERPRPKWLEFIVPDRFRRRIIGVDMTNGGTMLLDETLAKRLAKLPRLQYLSADVERWTPGMTDALAGMQRLRWVCITRVSDYKPKQAPSKHATLIGALVRWLGSENERSEGEGAETEDSESENSSDEASRASREFLEGIGKLTQIESLRLEAWEDFPRDELERLAGLKILKVLIVSFGPGSQGSLCHFPVLPKLETIHIDFSDVSGQDLRHLAAFPRLKSLDLTEAELDGAELADLAPLKSLEELSIAAWSLPQQSLESLRALKRLKVLTIRQDVWSGGFSSVKGPDRTTSVALDEGERLEVPEGEGHVFLRALETLRQSNPGIVIKNSPLDVFTFDISPPFEYEDTRLYSTWLPADSRLAPPSTMRRLGAASANPAGQNAADASKADGEK